MQMVRHFLMGKKSSNTGSVNKLGGKLVKNWTTLVNLMEFLKNIGLKDFLKMVTTMQLLILK